MWIGDQHGTYTVKSGYQVLQNWNKINSENPSTSDSKSPIWKKLWDFHTIPRHKMLLWRILNKALPLKNEL
jgi:hypothetical protein